MEDRVDLPKPTLVNRCGGWWVANGRRLIKRAREYLPGPHNRPEFQRHRYPGISLEELLARLRKFQNLLGYKQELRVEQLVQDIFSISG